MNPPTPGGGGDATGNRHSPMGVHKDSRKIRKPAVAPPPHHRKPVIIYDVEPRVIHTTAKDFKRVVHLLTGMPTAAGTPPIKDQEITGTAAAEPPVTSPGLLFSAPYNMATDLDPYMMMSSDPTLTSSPSSSSARDLSILSNPFFDKGSF